MYYTITSQEIASALAMNRVEDTKWTYIVKYVRIDLSMPEVLTVKRYMDHEAQIELAQAASEESGVKLKSALMSVLVRRQAAVTLVAERVYERALSDPYGSLSQLTTEESKAVIQESIRQASAASWLTAETTVTSRETERDTIVYNLSSQQLADEKDRSNDVVSALNNSRAPRLNLVNIALVLAVIRWGDDRADKLVEAFEAVRPVAVELMPADVLTAAEARAYRGVPVA